MDFINERINLTQFKMNKQFFLILILITSCEVQESKNIYKIPQTYEEINLNFELEKLRKNDIKKIESKINNFFDINNVNLIEGFDFFINKSDIQKYIDCGYMNNEIYVNYIERIFGSSLNASVKIDSTKLKDSYDFKSININYLFMSKETGSRWKFKTNKPKELLIGNPVYDAKPYRTCASKNVLEELFLSLINIDD